MASASGSRRPRPRRRPRSATRLRSTASVSPRPRSSGASSPSTRSPRRSGAPRSDGSSPGARSTSSRRSARASRSAVTSSRATWTGSGASASLEPAGDGAELTVEAPPELLRYCVEKGSITVDGVSLTVASLADDAFTIALIPHTLAETTLSALGPGDEVNLEVDVLAKYVERLVTR